MREHTPNNQQVLGELKFEWREISHRFGNPQHWSVGSFAGRFGSGPGHGWRIDRNPRTLADMNGDGKADIVGFANAGLDVAISSGTGISSLTWWWDRGTYLYDGGWRHEHSRHVVDMNGDGRADIVGFQTLGPLISLSDGNGTISWPNYWLDAFKWTNVAAQPRHLADFNGDGLPDIIGHGPTSTQVAINNGTGIAWAGFNSVFSKSIFSANNFNFGTNGSISLTGDINGDGREDIVVLQKLDYPHSNSRYYRVHYALSNGTSLSDAVVTDLYTSLVPNSNYIFNYFLKDVNGDGKADFVFACPDGMCVALATGNGFKPSENWINMSTNRTMMMLDVNGDGLFDIVAFDGNSGKVSLSTGTGFATEQTWTFDNNNFWGSNQNRWKNDHNFRTFADMDGDGLPDLVGFSDDGVWVSLNQATGYGQLVRVVDNLGNQFTAEYDVLSNSTIYTKGTTPVNFPLMNFQGALQVCKRLTTRANDKHYTYKGAVIHQQGRGFLGFSEITETDTRLQLKQVSEFELIPTYHINLPKKTTVSTLSNVNLSETSQTYNIKPLNGKRILSEVTQITSKNFPNGTQQTKRLTYDSWGNIFRDTTRTATIANPNTIVSTSVTVNTYINRAFRTPHNRLETTESYSWYTATPTQRYPQKQKFIYDSKGNLEQKIDRAGTAIPCTTTYTLHPTYGLVTDIVVTPTGMTPISQSFTYDTRFRFQLSNTTTGLGTSFQTYNIWGQILSETTIAEQTTNYQYNAFGRLWKKTTPDNITTTYTTNRTSSFGAVYVLEEKSFGRPYVKIYLDTLGRTIRTESPNPSGIVITETQYDHKGQMTRTSVPRFTNETVKWKEFTYDYAGRLQSEKYQNQTTNYGYKDNGLTSTVTPPGTGNRTSSKTYNAAGDLVSATDPGGTITYSYLAPGYVSQITAPGNATTTIAYDHPYGRQLSVTDPNAGTISYTYDNLDRIKTQIDARNNLTTNIYDDYGRLTEIQEANNRITTYSYIPSGQNRGRLQSITCNNGRTSHSYTYDYSGRVIQFDDKYLNNTLTTKYFYDSETGNLQFYQYPQVDPSLAGYTLYYTYNIDGFYTAIREDGPTGKVVWSLDSVNAFGQETGSTVVGGRTKTQTYNAWGQPLTMTLTGLMNYTYTYDEQTGNMLSRNNNLFNGQNETFGYDSLDRLTTGVAYQLNGNISSKSDVGSYTYDPIKKHAVTDVSGYYNPSSEQDITYNSFGKIQRVDNKSRSMYFQYGPTHQRREVQSSTTGVHTLVRFYTTNCEHTKINNNPYLAKEYIYSPYGLVAIRHGGNLQAVATDHLGSIVAEHSPAKNKFEFFGYDAWGKRYRFENGTKFYFGESLPMPAQDFLDHFSRGYTGHEHMDMFGLINMNGRMYDPVIGRMLSPDPYVPDGTYTQDFNRYTYARNNPLTYVDPDGEFVWSAINAVKDFFTIALTKGGLEFWNADKDYVKNAWGKDNWHSTRMAWKIDVGMLKTDPSKNFWGRAWELTSRFTWQGFQQFVGHTASHIHNLLGGVKSVDYYGGATMVESYSSGWGGITSGSYINVQRGTKADPDDWLFQHEYGHYRQSQRWGPAYLRVPGLSSLVSAMINDNDGHNRNWAEQNANKRGYEYFYDRTGGTVNWDKSNEIYDKAWLERFHQSRSTGRIMHNPTAVGSTFNWSIHGGFIFPESDIYRKHKRGRNRTSLKNLLLLYK
jgi:RHS repeat-associated protein